MINRYDGSYESRAAAYYDDYDDEAKRDRRSGRVDVEPAAAAELANR